MKSNLTLVLTLALVVLTFAAACNKNSNVSNSSAGNSSDTSSSNKTSSSSTGGMSPTEVYKAYYDTSVKRDFQAARKYLSQSTLDVMEGEAKKQGKTYEQMMGESPTIDEPLPPLTNEQISGDTATVDMTVEGHKVTIPFVKENGEWKVALDKLARDVMRDSQEGSASNQNDEEGEDHDNSNH